MNAILPFVNWSLVNSFLEPCRGSGAITGAIPTVPRVEWAELSAGVDYLLTPFLGIDLILTNPPFTISTEFLDKSLTEARCVIYLQRLNWLGAQKRRAWWQDKLPTHLFVLSERPKFCNGKTDATEYAWFCWDRGEIINAPRGVHVI